MLARAYRRMIEVLKHSGAFRTSIAGMVTAIAGCVAAGLPWEKVAAAQALLVVATVVTKGLGNDLPSDREKDEPASEQKQDVPAGTP